MSEKKQILFVLPDLGGGGAERVMTTLLSHLDRDRFAPSLALGCVSGGYLNDLPGDVDVTDLGSPRARYTIAPLVRHIHRTRPHAVFSTLGYLNLLIMLARPFMPAGVRFIGRETNIPSLNLAQSGYPRLLPFLYRHLYPHFDGVICQSRDMLDDMADNFSLPRSRAAVVHNPVDIERITGQAALGHPFADDGTVHLVAAGKLKLQKGFDLLLDAFAQLDLSRFKLTILGQGPDEAALRHQAHDLSIENRVDFVGFTDNPYPYLAGADQFVLSSRFEGFPNVVLESLALGTPVTAYDCPGGLGEIITPGFNGYLAHPGDASDLARQIELSAQNPFDSGAIQDDARQRFDVGHIVSRYEALLCAVVDSGSFGTVAQGGDL